MSNLNQTPSGERLHIAFFGKRNAGKSSLVNAFTGQDIAIVSDVPGTTTDPVYKAMELLPLGPVQIIDTPGIDDVGELGALRVQKTKQVLNKTDIAVIAVDSAVGIADTENELISIIRSKEIPFVVAYTKADLLSAVPSDPDNGIYVSSKTGFNITELKELVAKISTSEEKPRPLVSDLLNEGDVCVLVVPIDKAAPKGRLILPQQQTIRDILDSGASALVCRDTELSKTLCSLSEQPKIVITDSQAFDFVSKAVPDCVPLTSFSILMARYKGDLPTVVSGAFSLDNLEDGDKILIAEACTHHRQCNDIGTVKLPHLIRKYTGAEPDFHFCSGKDFPDDLLEFRLVVHCGGCMITEREMRYRLSVCKDQNIPITNYGILIAHINGILNRSVKPFGLNI
ncbi:MAG: [Clostridia bacterium]|nr:[FeFe] hydrogenase H-cluster maturation GTPase HydF [Clostridia bacterium]